MRRVEEDSTGEQVVSFGIHKVYYTDSGKMLKWTDEAIAAQGINLNDIHWVVWDIQKSLRLPVLDFYTGKEWQGYDQPKPQVVNE